MDNKLNPSKDNRNQKIIVLRKRRKRLAMKKKKSLRKQVVYEIGTDGIFKFKDEEPILVNRAVLAFNSKFFKKKFFGSKPKTSMKIIGFDRASFKTFLDCLVGIKKYTLLDALLIHPIARQYGVKESIEVCEAVLKPTAMDENVCHVLNLSTFYENEDVTDYLINFIKTECGIFNFLESKEYSNLLDTSAICKIIDNIDLNSLVWTLVYQWGENYIKEHDKPDVKSFFMECGILPKISFSHFESVQALVNFHEESKRQLLCSDEILNLLGMNIRTLPDSSEWVKIEPPYSFKEMIVFKNVFWVDRDLAFQNLIVAIWPNKILFEPANSDGLVELEIKAKYIFRYVFTNVHVPVLPRPIWRDDLHFFYREIAVPRHLPADYRIFALCPSNEFKLDLQEDEETPVYKFVIPSPATCLEIHSIEVTYNFKSPCRILKASLDQSKYSAEANNLYLTKKVAISAENYEVATT